MLYNIQWACYIATPSIYFEFIRCSYFNDRCSYFTYKCNINIISQTKKGSLFRFPKINQLFKLADFTVKHSFHLLDDGVENIRFWSSQLIFCSIT